MSRVLPFVLAVSLAVAGTVAVVVTGKSNPAPKTTLSERINAACPKAYYATDWETDGEFTNIPKGTVKVTCVAVDMNREPHQIYRSVGL